jgi:ABC-type transport system involved in multi-copper enzyme maturation permease subunit
MALALTIKYGLLDLATFRVGYNFIYFLVSIYLYGLWAIAFRNITSTVKWKAFALAVVPFILLLILGLAFDKIALTKVETWIAPLK